MGHIKLYGGGGPTPTEFGQESQLAAAKTATAAAVKKGKEDNSSNFIIFLSSRLWLLAYKK